MRHKWDHANQQRLAGDSFKDGNGRNIRVCDNCGHRRVTVIPPQGWPWREYPDDPDWHSQAIPPCVGKKQIKQVKNDRG